MNFKLTQKLPSDRRVYGAEFLMRFCFAALIFLASTIASANEHREFWYWLDDIKLDLRKAGKYSHDNEFRMMGYYNAVTTRLQSINPNLSGVLEEYPDDNYVLHLHSEGDAQAIDHIRALEHARPKKIRIKSEHSIEPSSYKNTEFFMVHEKNVQTDNAIFVLIESGSRININVYVPELVSIKDSKIQKSLAYRLKRFVIGLIGEKVYGERVKDINISPLLDTSEGAKPLSELNAALGNR